MDLRIKLASCPPVHLAPSAIVNYLQASYGKECANSFCVLSVNSQRSSVFNVGHVLFKWNFPYQV